MALRFTLAGATLLALLLIAAAGAAAGGDERAPTAIELLRSALAEADEHGDMPDAILELLLSYFVELIARQDGVGQEEVRTRVGVEGMSAANALAAVLSDAHEKGLVADDIIDLISNYVIESYIAPHTGETPDAARERLSATGPDETATPSQRQHALQHLLLP